MAMSKTRICLIPKVSGVGGMVSFRHRLATELERRGVEISDEPNNGRFEAVLVIGGTRNLPALWRARRHGSRIVQRLDGMNWLHRRQPTGLRHTIRAETGNWLLNHIRTRLADRIVYQSEFARGWWQRVYGSDRQPTSVIHNGVDLAIFTPRGEGRPPDDLWRVLMVEGSLMGGYELGLETAMALVRELAAVQNTAHSRLELRPVELQVVGRVSPQAQDRWQAQSEIRIRWAGLQAGERIPEIDRSAHLLFSADLNAACPNSVIEALGCGLPVLALDTGALAELVQGDAGRVVPYGGDPWQLDKPDIHALAGAAWDLLQDQERYRLAARQRAEVAFSVESMADHYLDVLLGE